MIRARFSNAEDQIVVHNIRTAYNIIAKFNEELNLTQDEINLIMFTSLDQDFFTNLIISQGQFTEWFNINFEGESQEEIDFKNNQEEEWIAIADQAKMVLAKYTWMVTAGHKKMDDILTQQWWNHERFANIGDNIAKVFAEDPAVLQKIRLCFHNHKDKLSYYDFFNHVEFDLKLKLKTW